MYKTIGKLYYWEVDGSISLYTGWRKKRSEVDHHFKREIFYFFTGNISASYVVLEGHPAKAILV